MKPYIEDRNGNIYELRRLTRREKLRLMVLAEKSDKTEKFEEKLAYTDDAYYQALKLVAPNLTKEEFEDILDFNDEKYGFEQLVKLEQSSLEWLFTRVGGATTTVHPYLQEIEHKQENNQVPVEETPQYHTDSVEI